MLLIAAALLAAPPVAGDDASAFMTKVLSHNSMGFTGTSEVDLQLTIRSAKGRLSHRRLQIKSAEIAGRQHSLVRFVAPAELAGTGMLMREESDGTTTQLMYQPSYDKVRPIAVSSRSGRFMGTDFSYADLEGANAKDGRYTYMADAKCGKSTCKQVESRPKKERVKSTGYGRVISLIHPVALVPMRSRFFDKDGKTELKVLTVHKLKKVDGQWMVTKAVMKDLRKGTATRIELLELSRKKTFGPETFTDESLRSP